MVVLKVEDNGIGITPGRLAEHQSLGLLGMRERVAVLAARFNLTEQPAEGLSLWCGYRSLEQTPGKSIVDEHAMLRLREGRGSDRSAFELRLAYLVKRRSRLDKRGRALLCTTVFH